MHVACFSCSCEYLTLQQKHHGNMSNLNVHAEATSKQEPAKGRRASEIDPDTDILGFKRSKGLGRRRLDGSHPLCDLSCTSSSKIVTEDSRSEFNKNHEALLSAFKVEADWESYIIGLNSSRRIWNGDSSDYLQARMMGRTRSRSSTPRRSSTPPSWTASSRPRSCARAVAPQSLQPWPPRFAPPQLQICCRLWLTVPYHKEYSWKILIYYNIIT